MNSGAKKIMNFKLLIITTYIFSHLNEVCFCGKFITTRINPQIMWNTTQVDILKEDLFFHYDRTVRPTQHNKTTFVEIGFSIYDVDINEDKYSFIASLIIKLRWTDDKLQWNPRNYQGLDSLKLADHELWKPDLYLYNSAVASPMSKYMKNHLCIVSYDGTVNCTASARASVLCNLDLKKWPFDNQECSMKFGSWTQAGNLIHLTLFENQTKATDVNIVRKTCSHWAVTNTTVTKNLRKYDCCEEEYFDVTLTISLKRQSNTARVLITAPSVAILGFILLSFILPFHSDGRIFMNVVCALIVCLFLLYFVKKLPPTGDSSPLIVSLFSAYLYLFALAIFESAFLTWLSRRKSHLPWKIKVIMDGELCDSIKKNMYWKCARLRNQINEEHPIEQKSWSTYEYRKKLMDYQTHEDWLLLGYLLDKVFLFIYFIVMIFLCIKYLF